MGGGDKKARIRTCVVSEDDGEVPNKEEQDGSSVDILLAEESNEGTDDERTDADTEDEQTDTKGGDFIGNVPLLADTGLGE